MSNRPQHSYQFGSFILNTTEHRLFRNGTAIPLTPRVYDLLLLFIHNNGQLLLRTEIMRTLWPNRASVSANIVDKYVSMLRKKLSPNGTDTPKYISTVSKAGYRFQAKVIEKGRRLEIAVLPLKSLSTERIGVELGLGMAEGLIVRLSRLDQISVRPTSAILKYTTVDQDPISAGKELRVDYVIEGMVQKDRTRLRVTIQLIDVSGKEQLWGEQYDERFTNIFQMQDSISAKIAESLTVRLTGRERKSLTKHFTENIKAYQLYKRGRFHWNSRTVEQIKKAIRCFQEANKLDPHYALPYAGIADSYLLLSSFGTQALPPKIGMPKAEKAASKALTIDDRIAEAHTSLAAVRSLYYWDWPGAEKEFKRAIHHNPNHATAHHWFANTLAAAGQLKRALAEVKIAQEADPVSSVIASAGGWILYFARHYDKAIKTCRHAMEMDEDFIPPHVFMGIALRQVGDFSGAIREFIVALGLDKDNPPLLAELGHAYALAGNQPEANRILKKLRSLSRHRYVCPFNFAKIFLGLREDKELFAHLGKAYDHRSGSLIFLNVEPAFDDVRSDSRFQDLVQRVGFA